MRGFCADTGPSYVVEDTGYHRLVSPYPALRGPGHGKSTGNNGPPGTAWWLNLTNLSDRKKDDILDMPIVPKGIFGTALASMQRQCEAKKKEDEALQLCLPRKAPVPSPPEQCKTVTQAASQVPQFKITRRLKPQPAPPPSPRQEARTSWPAKAPAPAAAPSTRPAQAASLQARKKKRAV